MRLANDFYDERNSKLMETERNPMPEEERRDAILFLIGFSGTGKSAVLRQLAQRLNMEAVDTDAEIVRRAGKAIPHIFSQDGEQHFRKLESQALEIACRPGSRVVATGGGIVLDRQNRERMHRHGMVACLEARPETIHMRLHGATSESSPEIRPLLQGDNPLQRIETLKASRQPYYATADWTVHTDNLTVDEVCQEVIRAWRHWQRLKAQGMNPGKEVVCQVKTATASYPIIIGWGKLEELGERMQEAGLSHRASLVSDDRVFSLHGLAAEKALKGAGFEVKSFTVPSGEKSKTLEMATRIYDFLIESRAERGDAVVALGGGMVGDLAGFTAATFLRGVPFVQVPTSLVAMVDAAIGGKVAVNHPRGKNLIGAFYQPCLVLGDVRLLTTLPHRELASGWAEVIKHALLFDPQLLHFLEDHYQGLLKLESELAIEALSRSAAIKAKIVGEDEREQGSRTLLNYGHTIGHALEVATGFGPWLHGEAVAIGMVGAAVLSYNLGLASSELVQRHLKLLARFGLPTSCPEVDRSALLAAMELDKKVRDRALRWVLLEDVARPIIRDDVPQGEVTRTLKYLAEAKGKPLV